VDRRLAPFPRHFAGPRRAAERDELLRRFEEVAALLQDLALGTAWDEATEPERRVLVEELVEKVAVFPDHLEVTIAGAPRLNVGLAEVGLGGKQSQNVGVGGPTCTISYYRSLAPDPMTPRTRVPRSRAVCRRAVVSDLRLAVMKRALFHDNRRDRR